MPAKRKRCIGKTPNAVDSSGAPKYALGIESRKVLDVATEIMKTAKIKGGVNERSNGETASRPTTTVFGWRPGQEARQHAKYQTENNGQYNCKKQASFTSLIFYYVSC